MLLPVWAKPAAVVLAIGALFAAGRYSSSPDRWAKTLADSVTSIHAAKTSDSLAYLKLRARDSVTLAALEQKSAQDSVRLAASDAAREAAIRAYNAVAPMTAAARKALAQARTIQDTITKQGGLITALDAENGSLKVIIVKDSARIFTGDTLAAGLKARLGVSQQQLATERDRSAQLQDQLGKLLAVAGAQPKGLHFFGFTVSFQPYIGFGLQYSPADKKFSNGIQLGISVLRK